MSPNPVWVLGTFNFIVLGLGFSHLRGISCYTWISWYTCGFVVSHKFKERFIMFLELFLSATPSSLILCTNSRQLNPFELCYPSSQLSVKAVLYLGSISMGHNLESLFRHRARLLQSLPALFLLSQIITVLCYCPMPKDSSLWCVFQVSNCFWGSDIPAPATLICSEHKSYQNFPLKKALRCLWLFPYL